MKQIHIKLYNSFKIICCPIYIYSQVPQLTIYLIILCLNWKFCLKYFQNDLISTTMNFFWRTLRETLLIQNDDDDDETLSNQRQRMKCQFYTIFIIYNYWVFCWYQFLDQAQFWRSGLLRRIFLFRLFSSDCVGWRIDLTWRPQLPYLG